MGTATNYRSYNLVTQPIQVGPDKAQISVVCLGERGRGRTFTPVPCPEGLADGASVELAQTRSGRPKIRTSTRIVTAATPWLTQISSGGAYVRGAAGQVSLPEGRARVVAEGRGAFGDAGRVGYWVDVLAAVETDTLVHVKPTRGPAYWLWFGRDEVAELEREDVAIWMDGLDEETGASALAQYRELRRESDPRLGEEVSKEFWLPDLTGRPNFCVRIVTPCDGGVYAEYSLGVSGWARVRVTAPGRAEYRAPWGSDLEFRYAPGDYPAPF